MEDRQTQMTITLRYGLLLPMCFLLGTTAGCDLQTLVAPVASAIPTDQTLVEARTGFKTNVVTSGDFHGPPDQPDGRTFELIKYQSPVGQLSAYLTPDPGDGQKHPAIVWITGGDNNTIGDVWSGYDRTNDQSASAFRKAGIVMMFPSQRGGNDNPGQREGFYGEVDDILAATERLAQLPYVDANQIYLGGHSTGGTMAMLVAECSDRYKAILALGPVANVAQYGGDFVYCDTNNDQEMQLRAPINWLHCVRSPMFVLEGADRGNWEGSIDVMDQSNTNPLIKFFPVSGHDHFSVIAPVTELMAKQIIQGEVNITQELVQQMR